MSPSKPVSSPLRLLHLEDSSTDAELIQIQLKKEWPRCKIERVDSKDRFLAALQQQDFDLILSDFSLPAFNGMEALSLSRAQKSWVPFLFLSGTIGEDNAVEALQRGAFDYVIKDRPARLIPAIKRALDRAREQQAHARAEQALREQAEVLDKARDAICVTDIHGVVTYWNQAAADLFLLREDAATSHTLDELFGSHNREAIASALHQLRADGAWSGELQLTSSLGDPQHIVSRWTLVRDDEGRAKSILAISTDITDQKKLEVQLLRSQRLEGIGTLAGGIAHDLNNVLTPILTSVSLLQMKITDPALLRVVRVVEASARHGAALIRQVLTFARGVEGERCELNPSLVIGEVMTLLQETLPRSVELQTDLPDDIWPIVGNSTQLSQVLMNLGVNARDAMNGSGVLKVRTRNVLVDTQLAQATPGAKTGPHVLVSVGDNGSGIPPEVINRIFDPFFTTKAAGKGTGLGLSTVLGIVKAHGGFLQVESAPGLGTEFLLYFPAASSRTAPAVPRQLPQTALKGGGESILLIDDEEGVREILQALLMAHGYQVRVASDGAEGLALYRKHRDEIDLVLTDMMMPGMQGTGVLHEIRRLNPTARLIAMSGISDESSRSAAAKEQTFFLAKPMTGEELLRAVREALTSSIV
ncbi:MAG TPA: response regulator [Opitutaceae bacterium]|nr:response regulator [Opitutaceae bacterium]